jgi:hypothetical protein
MGCALRETHRLRKLRLMEIAEFIIGPAEGQTRWLHPSYAILTGIAEFKAGSVGSTHPARLDDHRSERGTLRHKSSYDCHTSKMIDA